MKTGLIITATLTAVLTAAVWAMPLMNYNYE